MHVYVHYTYMFTPRQADPFVKIILAFLKGQFLQVIIAHNSKAIVMLSFIKEYSAKSWESRFVVKGKNRFQGLV
jgi:hypothetical protein